MANDLPYFQFYPNDWLADEKLGSCSLAARGLWIQLLCLMHKSDRRGYLQQANGQPYSLEQIGRFSGCSTDEAAHLLQELLSSGAASQSEAGIVFSRRIVKDDEKRRKCSVAGKKGGGSPRLRDPTYKGQVKGEFKGAPKPPLASGSMESGSLDSEEKPDIDRAAQLAKTWVFHLASKRNGYKRDLEQDIVEEFRELIRLGNDPGKLLEAIEDKERDHAEHFWQFKKRLERNSNGCTNGFANGTSSRLRAPEGKYANLGKTIVAGDSTGAPLSAFNGSIKGSEPRS